MITLGIDPGYERLGLAVIKTDVGSPDKLLYSACFTTPRTLSFHERLGQLAKKIEGVLIKHHPNILAVEELFFSGNQKTAMRVSEIRGMIIYLGVRAGVPIIDLTPLQVKMSITGYGRADKSQLTAMTEKLIGIPRGRRHDDEYDAIGIALTGAALARQILIHTRTGRRLQKKSSVIEQSGSEV